MAAEPYGVSRDQGNQRKKPIVLTTGQYFFILALLPEPYRTMAVVALCRTFRKRFQPTWAGWICCFRTMLRRGTTMKPQSSRTTSGLPDAVLWHVPGAKWLLTSGACRMRQPRMGSASSFMTSAGMWQASTPALAGIRSVTPTAPGWTTHGAPMGVQQTLMRHAAITMNLYGNALMEAKREVHTAVVNKVLRSL